ncbi:hypothetical protein CAPI_06625 [Corynebacterium capitovis DSM 44611]|uniref:hypothetical protein n=1 Tax=Corynebacterium capitovis TaxID=131081 RepID=UPI00037FD65D|nr:hypothetical protein [Corynebacterium capitovis]WKD57865.1 hypothetical protein CAPI_06625 [Corynebacterium capitovis DSM 44611]
MELLTSLFWVIAGGLILGAGLPALFSLGIHFVTPPAGSDDSYRVSGPRKIIAWVFFAITIAFIFAGILLIARERIEYFSGWDPYPFL